MFGKVGLLSFQKRRLTVEIQNDTFFLLFASLPRRSSQYEIGMHNQLQMAIATT